LIALDKNPGIRPIGIGEMERRIIGKAIIRILKETIVAACGTDQLAAGQEAGIEAIIHSMTEVFALDYCQGILLVDAENAFNKLNRHVFLHNIQFTCPEFSTVVINFYRKPSRLFVRTGSGGFELSSAEGTTQGCPLAMPIYSLGTLNLVKGALAAVMSQHEYAVTQSPDLVPKFIQAWYADDSKLAPLCITYVSSLTILSMKARNMDTS
jgi:hypothetical protein